MDISLKDRIDADLKAAMLSRDELTTTTLRGIKAAILNEEVAKGVREAGLDDAAIEQIIAKESKKRDEAAEMFERGGNHTSADKERAEKEIISVYLPAQLSEDELSKLIDTVIETMQPDGMKDMGKVIGTVKAQVGNSAEGVIVAKLVKTKLTK